MNSNDERAFLILKKFKLVKITNFLITIKDGGIKGVIDKIKYKKEFRKNLKDTDYKNINIGNITNYNNKVVVDIIVDENLNLEKIKEELNNLNIAKQISFNYIILEKKYNKNKEKHINYKVLKKLFPSRAFILITNKNINTDDFYYCYKLRYDDNLLNNINNLFNNIESIKLLANYNNKNCVTVKSGTFYDFEGKVYYSGGAERYLIDLYEIFKEKNINLDIYQNASKPFFRKYNGINVIGMSVKGNSMKDYNEFCDKQTQNYNNLTGGKSQLHIYSAFFECYPNSISPSIGISHGIGWDNESNRNYGPINFWENKRMVIEGAEKCDSLVSVDTNTANWFQTIDYRIGNEKFKVIPNYVNIKEFTPRKDFTKIKDKIIITYPRRLYRPRGLYIALNTAERILKKYKNVEFHFVGKGFKKDEENVNKIIKKYPNNIKCYCKSPFEMHEVYKQTDISLIPTLYSEGTSLSCLEAMASGNIVIATRVGGLSDLIINGHNGYLIEPNEEALYNTLTYVLDNYDKQIKIKKKAIEVAKTFNKTLWKERWISLIDKFNLKNKSNNIDLVEFYVNDINNLSDAMFNKIKECLLKKNLIYIRSKKQPEKDNISGNLIQLIDFNSEIVNTAKEIYIEKDLKNKVKRKEKIIVI